MARRRIKKARITSIALCPRGKNKMPVIYKADDHTVEFDTIVKAGDNFDEDGELTALVYVPEHPDTDGDVASAEVIKEMAYDAQKRGGVDLDIRHDGKPLSKEQAYVAETFIVQKGDERFKSFRDRDGQEVNTEGAWATVIKIDDPEIRENYREGDWGGVSMFGTAEVISQKQDDMADQVVAALAKRLGLPSDPDGDDDMKPEEMTAALEANNEKLSKSIVDGLTEAIPAVLAKMNPTNKDDDSDSQSKTTKAAKSDTTKDEPPTFTGDPTNVEDLAKHEEALELYHLRKDVDFNDPAQVAAYREKLAKMTEGAEEDEEEEMPQSKKRVSTRPVSKGDEETGQNGFFNVSKEDQRASEAGSRMAAFVNRRRGFAKT